MAARPDNLCIVLKKVYQKSKQNGRIQVDSRGRAQSPESLLQRGAAGAGLPSEHLCPELCGNVEPADLSALGADIDVSRADVLDAEPDEFADPCAGGGEAPDDEVPPLVRLPAEFPFEASVVFVGNDVVEERDFGHFDGFDFKFGFSGEFEVLVDASDTDIDRFGLVGIDQGGPVIEEILFVQVAVPGLEAPQGTEIGPYRVDGIVFLHQSALEGVKFHSVYKSIGFCKDKAGPRDSGPVCISVKNCYSVPPAVEFSIVITSLLLFLESSYPT